MGRKILVTDFDGTMTRRDFYSCAVERLLRPEDIEPWERFTRGEITHFEALRRIFARIRSDPEEVREAARAMEIDPGLRQAVENLAAAGWEVRVVSNGASWYIDLLLSEAGVSLEVLSNPSSHRPEAGLVIEPPAGSPHFDPAVGISKASVVRSHLARDDRVAFAGDGRPDADPAVLVAPELRFARGWLAEHLESRGISFHRFERWSDVAEILIAGDSMQGAREPC